MKNICTVRTVVDNTAPVITVLGENPATVELGSTYDINTGNGGATATDLSGDVTVVVSGAVDTSVLGTNTIV